MTRARAGMLMLLVLSAASCGSERNTPPGAALSIGELLGGADTLHARAVEPRPFSFPADHGPHPEFRTEWWYFTGNLTTTDGREVGYQLTFFRNALTDSVSYLRAANGGAGRPADSAATPGLRSRWRARHAYMAHFAVTDATADAFHAAERFARGATGFAGANAAPLRIWLESWSMESIGSAAFPLRLRAATADIALDLIVEHGKPIVLQGERGLSRKGTAEGNASYYYSLPRMPTSGSVRVGSASHAVAGSSWLDREWSTSALSPGVAGWDWMALQLDDSTELMVYRLRRDDGTADPFSAATFITRDGSGRVFAAPDFTMTPLRTWRAQDGVAYPIAWRIQLPALGLELEVTAAVADQELNLAVRYWEGMVRVRGTRAGSAVKGRGYLEMTGYAASPERVR